jgi:zinc transporter ZupT
MNITTIILLFTSVLLAVIIVEVFKTDRTKNINLLLTFSGAYLLAVTTQHLIPEVFSSKQDNSIGIFILIGFLFQIILEYFSKGIEHGHYHKNSSIPISVLVSLSIHAFIEGIPLSGEHLDTHAHNSLLTGIIMHKLPVSIVLLTIFLKNGTSKIKAYFFLLIFASMSPLGVLASNMIKDINIYHDEIMAIVIGILLHISTTIIFESSNGHQFSRSKILCIILGVAIAIISI